MDDEGFPAEWLRGALGLSVLGALRNGPTYGYALSQRLERAGLGVIKGGTLYPLLARLEADGLVTAEWQLSESGPSRKRFSLGEEQS